MNAEELRERMRSPRYRLKVYAYEYGRRTKYLLAMKWPELLGAALAVVAIALTEHYC